MHYPAPPVPPRKSNTGKTVAVIVAAVVLWFGGCGLLMMTSSPKDGQPQPSAAREPDVFVVKQDDVYLFDTKQAHELAVELATRGDYVNLGIHVQARGAAIPNGTRVKIIEQGLLTVRVQAESGAPSGWTARKFLAKVPR